MKYFLIAGEASGDLHGSNLVRQLMRSDPKAEIACWGGDLMEAKGARLLKHYRELNIMGFWEVLIRLPLIMMNFRKCRKQILEFRPDVVVMIDYPGFNLRIAEFLKSRSIRSYYYISPKVWAWKGSRVKKIKDYIDRMYVIFPFEVDFYREHDYRVLYFGNPLVESVKEGMASADDKDRFAKENGLGDKPVIALLPGSRKQEIKKILPVMLGLADYYSDYCFVVAGAPSVPVALYEKIIGDRMIKVVFNKTYSLLRKAEVAVVTSGTATLETALAGVPQVVCYRTSWINYQIARRFIKTRFISLVNLVMDREVVRELIQNNLTAMELSSEVNSLLPGGWKREVMSSDYRKLNSVLKGDGASAQIAIDIYQTLLMVNNVN